MVAKKRKNSGFEAFTIYFIFPLMLIDSYAFWKVHKSSEHWISGIFTFSEPLSQLAMILAVNIMVIFALMIRCASK